MKIAVVLFNLGGPDAKESVEPFLYNFFTDPNIIRLPGPFRRFLAKRIASKRSRKEAGDSYKFLNWKSPLLENSEAQGRALETVLNRDGGDHIFKSFICMRYWHPMAGDVVQAVKAWGAERIVLLPLYPQFSTTTTRSSFQSWKVAAAEAGLSAPASALCCYPFQPGFIDMSVQQIKPVYAAVVAQSKGKKPRLLFSAHGLPETIIRSGDPYQWQCEQSAKRIAEALNIPDLDWQICYQSRVGRLKWIGPSTTEALEKAAVDQVPVVIYPHAFVSEHVETLVEIEIEYRHLATELGVPGFARVETVGTGATFIDGLKTMVLGQLDSNRVSADGGERLCPSGFAQCCMNDPTANPL
jgi:ferrochelatase